MPNVRQVLPLWPVATTPAFDVLIRDERAKRAGEVFQGVIDSFFCHPQCKLLVSLNDTSSLAKWQTANLNIAIITDRVNSLYSEAHVDLGYIVAVARKAHLVTI